MVGTDTDRWQHCSLLLLLFLFPRSLRVSVSCIVNGKEVVLITSLEEQVLLYLITRIGWSSRCEEVIIVVLLGDLLLLLLLCFLCLVSLRISIISFNYNGLPTCQIDRSRTTTRVVAALKEGFKGLAWR